MTTEFYEVNNTPPVFCISRPVIERCAGVIPRLKLHVSAAEVRGHYAPVFICIKYPRYFSSISYEIEIFDQHFWVTNCLK